MSDEKPLIVRKAGQCSRIASKLCIIHYPDNVKETDITDVTDVSFAKILTSASVRQGLSIASQRLDCICQDIPPKFEPGKHGYHRKCYQRFTNVSKFANRDATAIDSGTAAKDSIPAQVSSRTSCRSSASTAVSSPLFPNRCIFCGFERRNIPGNTSKELLTLCVTKEAESRIKEVAILSQNYDIIAKVEGVDLIALEAKYHESCRGKFIRPFSSSTKKETESEDPLFGERRAAHDTAFEYLCEYVRKHVIIEGSVLRMTMLRDKYNGYMQENFPSFHNQEYPTQRVKEKLSTHFSDQKKRKPTTDLKDSFNPSVRTFAQLQLMVDGRCRNI